MPTGVASSTLLTMLADREAERTRLEAQRGSQPSADILPHAELLLLFGRKVAQLRETLTNEAVRGQAAEVT